MTAVYTKEEFEAILQAQPLIAKAGEILSKGELSLTAFAYAADGGAKVSFLDPELEGAVIEFGED